MTISLWIKIPFALFVSILVPVYWLQYGPKNFLWGSDIAVFVTLIALWTESRLLASMAAVGVLVPETAWIIDFALRLIFGPEALPSLGTRYMFDPEIAPFTRGLSLFHVVLPVLLVWLIRRLGYDRRALLWQSLLTWLVLPVTYLTTEPSANVNWVYGLGREPQSWMPSTLYLALMMLVIPAVFYVPTHLLLKRAFATPGDPLGRDSHRLRGDR